MTTLKPGDWATYAPDSLDNVTGPWVKRIGRTYLVVAGVTNDSRAVVYDDESGRRSRSGCEGRSTSP